MSATSQPVSSRGASRGRRATRLTRADVEAAKLSFQPEPPTQAVVATDVAKKRMEITRSSQSKRRAPSDEGKAKCVLTLL